MILQMHQFSMSKLTLTLFSAKGFSFFQSLNIVSLQAYWPVQMLLNQLPIYSLDSVFKEAQEKQGGLVLEMNGVIAGIEGLL